MRWVRFPRSRAAVCNWMVLIILCLTTGCGKARGGKVIRSADDMRGARVAHMSSGFHRKELEALQPDLVFAPYTEYQFAIESLRQRKIDAISLAGTIAEIWMAKFPGEFSVAFAYAEDHCVFLFPKGFAGAARINAEMRRLKAEGACEEVMRKWKVAAKAGTVPDLPTWNPPPGAPVLRVAAAAQ